MAVRQRTVEMLIAGLALSTGTPLYLALSNGLETYLLHPGLFLVVSVPFVLAGALWLPYRTKPGTTAGLAVSGVLLLAAVLIHMPMLTGLVPMGGDMVALAFVVIALALGLFVVTGTALAQAWLFVRRRRHDSADSISRR
jgi:hypothetical protein